MRANVSALERLYALTGSAGPPALGIFPVIYDEEGKLLQAGLATAGNLCIRNPWPGIMQTIWADRERFVNQDHAKYCRNKDSKDWRDWPYFAGDGRRLGNWPLTTS